MKCEKCQNEFTSIERVQKLCPSCLLSAALLQPAIHVECPHCHSLIEIMDEQTKEMVCPTCASHFEIALADCIELLDRPLKSLGRFELLSILGIGGFGTVWQARDTQLNRLVAIKLPKKRHFADQEEEDRFLREGRVAAQLRHPGIVPVFEVGRIEDQAFIVTEFVRGITLAESAKSKHPTFNQTAEWLAMIAQSLDYSHQMGVIHRDLKPSNIILEIKTQTDSLGHSQSTFYPRLMDFGSAKHNIGESTLTLEGTILGTPVYMSPEQIRASHSVDRRTDIYSLGVVLYELLTGELPFRGTPQMVIHHILTEIPRSPRLHNNKIPVDLETITLKCLEKEPSRRYQTSLDVADDLQRWLRGDPIKTRSLTTGARVLRWCKRKPAIASLSVSFILAILFGLIGITWQWQRAETNLLQAEHQRRLAIENAARARQIVNEFLGDVEIRLGNTPGLQPMRRDLLEKMIQHYKNFLKEDPHNAEMVRNLAETYERMGDVTARIESKSLAMIDYKSASRLLRKQILRSPDPATETLLARINCKYSLLEYDLKPASDTLIKVEKPIQTIDQLLELKPRLNEELIALQIQLAQIQIDQGLFNEALVNLYRSRTIVQTSDESKKNRLWYLGLISSQHAETLRRMGNSEEALQTQLYGIQLYEKEPLPLMESQTGLGNAYFTLGKIYEQAGQTTEALSSLSKASKIFQSLQDANPVISDFTIALGNIQIEQGRTFLQLGKPEDALEFIRKGIQLLESAKQDDSTLSFYRDLAWSYYQQGYALAQLGRHKNALSAYEKGEGSLPNVSDELLIRSDLLAVLNATRFAKAEALRTLDRSNSSEAIDSNCLVVQKGLVQKSPKNQQWREQLDLMYTKKANTLKDTGELQEAIQIAKSRMELWPDQSPPLYTAVKGLASLYRLYLIKNPRLPEIEQAILKEIDRLQHLGSFDMARIQQDSIFDFFNESTEFSRLTKPISKRENYNDKLSSPIDSISK